MDETSRQQAPEESEQPYEGRLRAFLHELVAEQGRMRAADALGVNYKTLARALDEPGPLKVRLREALLTKALERGAALPPTATPAPSDDGGAGSEAPPDGIDGTAGEVRGATDAVQALADTVEQLRHEHGERLADSEQQLTAVETPRSGGAPAPDRGAPRIAVRPTSAPVRPPTASPTVVTEEAGPDDERAYGPAWPLVEEWRAVRARHPAAGRGVDWLRDGERLRELEIALIGNHELALPPQSYRWDGLTRRAQLRWRERTLERVRGERRRAQWLRRLRRLLTLGIWWA